MRVHLYKYWDRIRSSLWFVPTLTAGAAMAAAQAGLALDRTIAQGRLRLPYWIFDGDADGASAVLETIAGSMITIAGVVFSITLVVLTLASSQFGPRLLRNFMRDTANQLVLGTFVSTFLYCLLVLRAIRRADGDPFVPHLAVTLGVALALLSLGVLIFFIHHVAVSIQADQIIARVATELNEGIDRQYPADRGRPGRTPPRSELRWLAAPPGVPAYRFAPGRDGYLQFVDDDALLAIAAEHRLRIRVDARPGQYVTAGRTLIRAWPADRVVDALAARFDRCIVVGDERTPQQDLAFVASQLAEIAVRALSPGINDPFTAVHCVDRLGSALHRLAARPERSAVRCDADGRPRVVACNAGFVEVLAAAFEPIRQNARHSPPVLIGLLEAVALIAESAMRPEDRQALAQQARAIAADADALPARADRDAVRTQLQVARSALEEPNALPGC